MRQPPHEYVTTSFYKQGADKGTGTPGIMENISRARVMPPRGIILQWK